MNTLNRKEQDLVLQWLPLCRKRAFRFHQATGAEYEDLTQVACLGVIRAITRWDKAKEERKWGESHFTLFAQLHIDSEIKHYLRDKHYLVRTPRAWSQNKDKSKRKRLHFDSLNTKYYADDPQSDEKLDGLVCPASETVEDWPLPDDLSLLYKRLTKRQIRVFERHYLLRQTYSKIAEEERFSKMTSWRELDNLKSKLRRFGKELMEA